MYVSIPPLDRNQKIAANCPTAMNRMATTWKIIGSPRTMSAGSEISAGSGTWKSAARTLSRTNRKTRSLTTRPRRNRVKSFVRSRRACHRANNRFQNR